MICKLCNKDMIKDQEVICVIDYMIWIDNDSYNIPGCVNYPPAKIKPALETWFAFHKKCFEIAAGKIFMEKLK